MSVVTDISTDHAMNQRPICHVFDLPIDRLTVQQVIDKVESYIRTRSPHQLAYLNAHCINQAFEDNEYRKILQQCDLVYPDGMGVVWASHLTHSPLPERVNIGDFLIPLLQLCEKKKYKIYFLGGEEGIAEKAVANLKVHAPNLQVVGMHHGYFTDEEEKTIIKEIIQTKPEILLVGFGVPDQEKWIHQHLDEINVPVAWGVGALFEYYSGKVSRAPFWMRSHGLEWLYRLVLEPGRMWKRYLIGNLLFIMKVIALVAVDILTAATAWFAAYFLRLHLSPSLGPINAINTYIYSFPLIVILWIGCSAWYGLYRRSKPISEFQEFYAIAKSAFLSLLISTSVAFLIKEWDLGRSVILSANILNFLFLIVSRKLTRLWRSK